MLDFIVLGIVPGTNFTITFWWSVAFGLIFTSMIVAYIELSKLNRARNKHDQQTLEAASA